MSSIDINGFGKELREYITEQSKSLSETTPQTIAEGIKKIFQDYGVNNSNFKMICMAVEADKTRVDVFTMDSYINKLASNIDLVHKKYLEKQKSPQDKENEQQDDRQQSPHKRVVFDRESYKDMTREEILKDLKQKFLEAGYTEEELARGCNKLEKTQSKTLSTFSSDKGVSNLEELADFCYETSHGKKVREYFETMKKESEQELNEQTLDEQADIPDEVRENMERYGVDNLDDLEAIENALAKTDDETDNT